VWFSFGSYIEILATLINNSNDDLDVNLVYYINLMIFSNVEYVIAFYLLCQFELKNIFFFLPIFFYIKSTVKLEI